jgi:hypothetical protein
MKNMNPSMVALIVGLSFTALIVLCAFLILPGLGSAPTAVALIILPSFVVLCCFIPTRKRELNDINLVYNDKHVEIYQDRLVLAGYWFGPFGRKKIPFPDIAQVQRVDLKKKGLITI